MFNRIVGLRGAAAGAVVAAPATDAAPAGKSNKAKTRPPKRSGAEFRAEARARDAALAAAYARFKGELGLSEAEADVLSGDPATVKLFEATAAASGKPVAAARLLVNELPRVLGDRELDELLVGGAELGALVALVEAGTITGPAAKEVLAELVDKGGDPREIVEARGLSALADEGALEAIVNDVLAKNAAKVAEYRSGSTGLIGFFVGQVVRAAQGKASPQLVQEIVARLLGTRSQIATISNSSVFLRRTRFPVTSARGHLVLLCERSKNPMRIVILGGGYAGLYCATRLARRARRGPAVEIVLVNANERFVERIRLHQWAVSGRAPERDLRAMLRGTGVDFVHGQVTGVDLERRVVHVGEQLVPFDRLVVALGSHVEQSSVPGLRTHALTLDSGRVGAFARAVPALALRHGHIVIVGGGLTGIEAAAELAEAWPSLRVTLLVRGRIAEGWSEAARAHVVACFARLGVELREGVAVHAVGATHVETSAGPLACDACLWAGGFVASELPRHAGLAVNQRGQVLVDPALRSISHPFVYAIGDAAMPVEAPGQVMPMGCKSAAPMGVHVAENLARALRGERERGFDLATAGYCVSLGRKDGLFQLADREGQLAGRLFTGRLGAWIKELICRTTVWMLALERRGLAATTWVRTGRAPQLPAGAPQADEPRLVA